MIKAIYHRKDNKLTIEGHASSGEAGHDLVCAAASALVYTLAAFVTNMATNEQVKNPIVNLNEGNAEVSCKPSNKLKAAATLVFDSICAGYDLLASQYPENITYEIRV